MLPSGARTGIHHTPVGSLLTRRGLQPVRHEWVAVASGCALAVTAVRPGETPQPRTSRRMVAVSAWSWRRVSLEKKLGSNLPLYLPKTTDSTRNQAGDLNTSEPTLSESHHHWRRHWGTLSGHRFGPVGG